MTRPPRSPIPPSARRRPIVSALTFVVAMVLTGCSGAPGAASATPDADAWTWWAIHDAASTATIDHTPFDRLLATYVVIDDANRLHRFAYGRVSPADRQALTDYIEMLQRQPISDFNRDEQFAYWVNLYNAVTLKVVLDHYPVASIRDISDGVLSRGPWDRKLVTVEGQALSLNDIEHRILRPLWLDPRVHYAVNCASVGCPNLQTRAYTAADLDRQLDAAARAYINGPRGVRFERDGRLVVSSIYVWFREDFGGSDDGVIRHLRMFADPALEQRLRDRTAIDGHTYDWTLNGM